LLSSQVHGMTMMRTMTATMYWTRNYGPTVSVRRASPNDPLARATAPGKTIFSQVRVEPGRRRFC
jgi:hypothetical protein